jgi:sulfofructose kinase
MRFPLELLPDTSRPFDVVGFGENSTDLLASVRRHPTADSKMPIQYLARLPGGQVATAMVACARLGWRARYVGRVGSDPPGRSTLESLQREGVNISSCAKVQGATSRFSILITSEEQGTRSVLWHRDPRLAWPPSDVPSAAIGEGRVLLVDGTDMVAAAKAIESAQTAGLKIVVDVESADPGMDDLLRRADIIIAARGFPAELTGIDAPGAALTALAAEYSDASIVCVTLGEEGSLTRCAGREIRTPAFPIACVDSTGSGDVFHAAFIAGWLTAGESAELEEVLRYASAAAALNCRAFGAWTASPRADEVEELLHST